MKKVFSGFCALALLVGVTAACNQAETDRVGGTSGSTPSASPGTTTRPGSSTPSGSATGSGSTTGTTGSSSTTTSPSGSGSSSTTK